MSNPIEHARDALAGRVETEPNTVICDVCDREIPYVTARVIPAIGFMCPENVEPKCEPQRSIWDEIKDAEAKDKQRRIDSIVSLFEDACSDYADLGALKPNLAEYAEKAYAIAIDPTRYIEERTPPLVHIWWDEGVTHITRADTMQDQRGERFPSVHLPIEVDDTLLAEYEEARQAYYEHTRIITDRYGMSPHNPNYQAEWDAYMAANPLTDDEDDTPANDVWAEYLDG